MNSATNAGATPLHIACQCGNTKVAQLLVESGSSVDTPTEDGITPLMFAARNGHLQVVCLLVENGADIFTTLDENAAMDWAVEDNHTEVAEYLNLHTRLKNMSVHAQDTGVSTLMVASETGHVDVAEEMLKLGTDVDEVSNGKTPLFAACEQGFGQMVGLLLEYRANPDCSYKNLVEGTTSTGLIAAIQIGGFEAVQQLAYAGVDLTEVCQERTPLDWALDTYENDKATYDMFQEAEAAVNQEKMANVANAAAQTGTKPTTQTNPISRPLPNIIHFIKLYLDRENVEPLLMEKTAYAL